MPTGATVKEAEVLELFKTYGQQEVFRRFLRDLAERDKETYFMATNDNDRFKVRGARERALYFISLIQKSNDKRKGDDKPERTKY